MGRVPLDEINARAHEIQSWLRQRITVAELLAKMTGWDKHPSPPENTVAAHSRAIPWGTRRSDAATRPACLWYAGMG